MSSNQLPEWLINKINDAIDVLKLKTPDVSTEATKMLRAIGAGSPILGTRFRTLIDNALNSDGHDEFTREDKQLFGEIMIELSGGNTYDGEGRTVTKRIRFTPSEVERLEIDAQNTGDTFSQYVRRKLGLFDNK
jgi:hypothetical protein